MVSLICCSENELTPSCCCLNKFIERTIKKRLVSLSVSWLYRSIERVSTQTAVMEQMLSNESPVRTSGLRQSPLSSAASLCFLRAPRAMQPLPRHLSVADVRSAQTGGRWSVVTVTLRFWLAELLTRSASEGPGSIKRICASHRVCTCSDTTSRSSSCWSNLTEESPLTSSSQTECKVPAALGEELLWDRVSGLTSCGFFFYVPTI